MSADCLSYTSLIGLLAQCRLLVIWDPIKFVFILINPKFVGLTWFCRRALLCFLWWPWWSQTLDWALDCPPRPKKEQTINNWTQLNWSQKSPDVLQNNRFGASLSDLVSVQSLLPGCEVQIAGALIRFLCECGTGRNPLRVYTSRWNLVDQLQHEQKGFGLFIGLALFIWWIGICIAMPKLCSDFQPKSDFKPIQIKTGWLFQSLNSHKSHLIIKSDLNNIDWNQFLEVVPSHIWTDTVWTMGLNLKRHSAWPKIQCATTGCHWRCRGVT